MTDDNDLVKRLRKRQEFEFIDGYKRIEWEDDDALEAADRIEALEAKLAKAVEAMSNLRQAIRESGVKRTGCMYPAVLSFDAILAELKGDKV